MTPLIKKLIVAICLVLALLAGLMLALPWIIGAAELKTEISRHLESQHQLTLEIAGETDTNTFPSPKIYYKNITIKTADGVTMLQAPSMVLHLSWSSIFNERASVIEFFQPEIYVSSKNLRELLAINAANTTPVNATIPTTLQFTQGSLSIKDSSGESSITYQQLNAKLSSLNAGSEAHISAAALLNNHPVSLNAKLGLKQGQPSSALITLNQGSTIALEGNLSTTEPLHWQGHIKTNLATLTDLTQLFYVAGTEQPASSTPTAVVFEGSTEIDTNSLTISRTRAIIGGSEGTLSAYLSWKKALVMAFELNTKALDIQGITDALAPNLLSRTIAQDTGVAPLVVSPTEKDSSITLLLRVDEAVLGPRKNFHKLNVDAEFDQGNLILHQLNVMMPGSTTLDVQGAMVQQPEGRRFSGKANMRGEHLNLWLAEFEPYAKNLPDDDFSNFNIQGNLFVSDKQLRLSEATLNINKFELQGGFATYFEKTPRVEAEIKLKNADLDYFRDAWRTKRNASDDTTYNLLLGDGAQFGWLKNLPGIFDFNIAIEGFRFLDAEGQLATMRLYMTPGELNLYGVDMRLPENSINGNVKFNVLGERPDLSVVLSANQFNTDYLNTDKTAGNVPWFDVNNTEARWSDKLFDVRWMSAIDGSIDLSISRLTHNNQEYDNFKWRAELEKTAMNIQKLAFNYLGGTFDLNGSLLGGKVPSLSASFALYNGDLNGLLSTYFNTSHINGRISLTGVVSASGINMKTWIEQGDMKLTTVARGVRVQGLNLQSVLDTAADARSTQDVADGVRGLIYDGTTELTVDGNVNFQQGTIKTPGIRMTSNRITGNMKGEIQLLPWTLNLSTEWQFPELSSATIPTMTTSQQGGINNYTTRVDTASLEAFVAKRIVGQ